jgi:4-hydroxybenzoyl-CoA thioesterase
MRKAFYGEQRMVVAHQWSQPVSFGDCDPAGIVFYPNYFAWFDRTFHDWLRKFGGHAAICESLEALGIGLMEVNAKFRAPSRDGDVLDIALSVVAWEGKTLRLAFEGKINGRTVVLGQEVRGLFKTSPAGMFAADIEALKAYLENHGVSQKID